MTQQELINGQEFKTEYGFVTYNKVTKMFQSEFMNGYDQIVSKYYKTFKGLTNNIGDLDKVVKYN